MKTVFTTKHGATTIIVAQFQDVTTGAKGLTINLGGKIVQRAYNPAEVTVWFQTSSKANIEGWKAAYHASGLTAADFVRPRAAPHPASYYTKLVPTPTRASFRQDMTPARESTMLRILGKPGPLTEDCSLPTGDIVKKHQVTRYITPTLHLTGFDLFLDIVEEVIKELTVDHPNLVPLISSAGCECCREVRGYDGHWSNHSWGTACDFKIGGVLAPLNAMMIPYGIVILAQYFAKHDVLNGGGYNGRTDPMHEEASDGLIISWSARKLI